MATARCTSLPRAISVAPVWPLPTPVSETCFSSFGAVWPRITSSALSAASTSDSMSRVFSPAALASTSDELLTALSDSPASSAMATMRSMCRLSMATSSTFRGSRESDCPA